MPESSKSPSHHPLTIEGKIAAGLDRIAQAFRILLWNEAKALSLTPIQIQILLFLQLHAQRYCKVSYLAREFNMTKATISEVIKVLGEKGLVKKEYEETDRRSYTLHLTRKGRDFAARTSDFKSALLPPIEQMEGPDKQTLLLAVVNIVSHLNKTGIIPTQRMCFTCSFYRPNREGHAHFCSLLDRSLEVSDLRLDCPEHEPGIVLDRERDLPGD